MIQKLLVLHAHNRKTSHSPLLHSSSVVSGGLRACHHATIEIYPLSLGNQTYLAHCSCTHFAEFTHSNTATSRHSGPPKQIRQDFEKVLLSWKTLSALEIIENSDTGSKVANSPHVFEVGRNVPNFQGAISDFLSACFSPVKTINGISSLKLDTVRIVLELQLEERPRTLIATLGYWRGTGLIGNLI